MSDLTDTLEDFKQTKPDFDRAVHAHRLELALRCAQFEARHTGPFNWSGKEIILGDYKDPENAL